jgi:class 3 adenylate cyclase/pimeloyl-ACP methyl ester carboxylesterase
VSDATGWSRTDRSVRYVQSGDGLVAYEVFGSGAIDLLLIDDWGWHLEAIWDDPDSAAYFERLGSFARVTMFNRRGIGLSDPVPIEQIATLDTGVDDVLAVLDAAGIDRPAVWGMAGGTPVAAVFAAVHPERVRALILGNDTSWLAWPHDDVTNEMFDWYVSEVEKHWGTGWGAASLSQTRASDPGFVSWLARMQRLTCSPRIAAEMFRATHATDLSNVLPLVRVPTLVVHMLGWHGADRPLADLIPDARYVELPGDIWPGIDAIDEVEEFLTGVRPVADADRALATIVFTDIVDSTSHAARIGDANWRTLLDRHDDAARVQAGHLDGRIVKSVGDGVLAIFTSPTRAARFALAMQAALRPHELVIRAGVHTGEVELRGDDVGGLAVHIAARIADLAGPSEVLASRTVKELTAGSGLAFVDHGTYALKGVPDEWQLFSLRIG